MYQKIIIAIDGSEHSNRAISHGKALADKFGAELLLVHAYPHTSDLFSYNDFEKLISRRKAEGQKILDDARQTLGQAQSSVEEELLEGPEAEAILTVASIREVDLIVMGTRGMGSLEGMLFGSVSNKVVHQAPCSVLIVR